MNKNEMTIAEIHKELKILGFGMKLEVLTQMKPSELRKFLKKARKSLKEARKSHNLVNELYNKMDELESLLADSLAK